MKDVRIQVVGVIRFSVLAEGFAVDLYGGMDRLRQYLFDSGSLGWRFHIFENLGLPSLLRQTDPDFQLVLLTSIELPDYARERLEALVAPYGNLHVHAEGVEKQHRLIRRAYDSIPHDGYTHRAAFRLDNDDAVCMTFVERLKHLSHGLLDLGGTDEPTAIAFNRGFYVEMKEDEPHEVYDTVEREPLSTGTALLSRAGYHLNPYRYNHRAVAQHFNTYSDISFPVFLRTVHGENIDRVMKRGLRGRHGPRRIEKQIRSHFGMEMQDIWRLKCPPRD
ncbi:Putative rhamnosyl transferase [Salinihabitans flavidus]|uniref:Putative rhamnosyl transferase n=1 Tax=Salinihabitans flavidus TaxID=569882 RepID=A0A1H8S6I0_9RHOB|nr:glycosyltransferase [Salinihabitans flavidus]SEO74146.1 Putative rhamnosyl transferase [Salinihabitans flavidus]